jgi:hypothetical protein
MRQLIRRIGHDIRHMHNIDLYAFALAAFVLAALAVAGDALSGNPRWAVLLAGMGLLVFRMTLPERSFGSPDDVLHDRSAFEDRPFPARLRQARELWVFAPSAINLLSPQTCDTIRSTVLDHPDGIVRVVILDPAADSAVRFATMQLDDADSLDSPTQLFRAALQATIGQLQRMAGRQLRGSFEYRLLDYSPGFSLVAINPAGRDGVVIVEFHGFHSQVTSARMHIELTRSASEQWYAYWLDQFERIWREARAPA